MSGVIFDIKEDMEVVAAGGFFCAGCLTGKPLTEQSRNKRYCQDCYEFLKKEAERDRAVLTPLVALSGKAEAVTKIKGGVIDTPRKRGRPRKATNEPVSRQTKWRRSKKGRQ